MTKEKFTTRDIQMGTSNEGIDTILEEVIKDKPSFWKTIIEEHVLSC